jgi:hypothetical protein
VFGLLRFAPPEQLGDLIETHRPAEPRLVLHVEDDSRSVVAESEELERRPLDASSASVLALRPSQTLPAGDAIMLIGADRSGAAPRGRRRDGGCWLHRPCHGCQSDVLGVEDATIDPRSP